MGLLSSLRGRESLLSAAASFLIGLLLVSLAFPAVGYAVVLMKTMISRRCMEHEAALACMVLVRSGWASMLPSLLGTCRRPVRGGEVAQPILDRGLVSQHAALLRRVWLEHVANRWPRCLMKEVMAV